jgi:hypothetical protein
MCLIPAPLEESARLERIGVPLNMTVANAPACLFLTGGATKLDGMNVRHVTFEGVEIHYDGGATILNDLSFVDCKFVFENNGNARRLAFSILSPSQTVKFEVLHE